MTVNLNKEIQMKHLIIASILALTATVTSASLPTIVFENKKYTLNDTFQSLNKKLGKPSDLGQHDVEWDKPNYIITAHFDEDIGLSELNITQKSKTPTTNYILVNGKTFYLGKDTLNKVASTLDYGCFNSLPMVKNDQYHFTTASGAEGEINVSMGSTHSKSQPRDTALDKPITVIELNYYGSGNSLDSQCQH